MFVCNHGSVFINLTCLNRAPYDIAMYVRMEKHVAHQGITYKAVTRGKLAGDIPGLYSSLQQ